MKSRLRGASNSGAWNISFNRAALEDSATARHANELSRIRYNETRTQTKRKSPLEFSLR
jgi:hypothetical protein